MRNEVTGSSAGVQRGNLSDKTSVSSARRGRVEASVASRRCSSGKVRPVPLVPALLANSHCDWIVEARPHLWFGDVIFQPCLPGVLGSLMRTSGEGRTGDRARGPSLKQPHF